MIEAVGGMMKHMRESMAGRRADSKDRRRHDRSRTDTHRQNFDFDHK